VPSLSRGGGEARTGPWASGADGPSIALTLTQRLLNSTLDHDLTSHLRSEINGLMQSFSTEDVGEAIRAFGEKRRPVFRGK
jgi:2-(1,2-epoxy-1,2-dihydrophenyl)acetyl-CoA isomerase